MGRGNDVAPQPRSSPLFRYIKQVSILTLLIVIIAVVAVFVSYRVMGAEFDTDLLTENDIPLVVGASVLGGVGLGAMLASAFSPVSFIRDQHNFLDEIEVPERKKREEDDKKNKKDTASDEQQRKRTAAAEKRRRINRDAAIKRNATASRRRATSSMDKRTARRRRRLKGMKRSYRGVRYMRGLLRLLFRR